MSEQQEGAQAQQDESAEGKKKHVRHKDDFYATPEFAVDALWPYIKSAIDADPTKTIVEPSAGDGAIVKKLIKLGVPPERIVAVEQDAERSASCEHETGVRTMTDDTLTLSYDNACAVIMNPPFRAAREHIEHAVKHVVPRGGIVCALARLSFLGSKRRIPFWQKYPADILVLSRRPSFTPDGKTDASEYMWIVFGPGLGGRWTVVDCGQDEGKSRRTRRKKRTEEMFPEPAGKLAEPMAKPEAQAEPATPELANGAVEKMSSALDDYMVRYVEMQREENEGERERLRDELTKLWVSMTEEQQEQARSVYHTWEPEEEPATVGSAVAKLLGVVQVGSESIELPDFG